MIRKLSIQNFKSIKNLQIECKRVNLFIGEPNSGKSNLLEALSLLNYSTKNLSDFVRFHEISHLFHDYDTSEKIEVQADDSTSKAWVESDLLKIENYKGMNSPFLLKFFANGKFQSSSSNDAVNLLPRIAFYRYNSNVHFEKSNNFYLTPPFGENLPSMVLANKELRTLIQGVLEDIGFKLLIKPFENDIEIIREHNGISLSFPLISFSDTIKRIIFYMTAIKSNKESLILLEEPEAHIFPFYTKFLAETIANQSDNQYFLVTHNPYFLQSIVEKTPSDQLSVNLVQMEQYQTNVTTLTEKGKEEILSLSSDVFLNFDKLLEA